MRRAAEEVLLGTHDFTALMDNRRPSGVGPGVCRCHLYRLGNAWDAHMLSPNRLAVASSLCG
jgi:hypothetical protein